MNDVAVREDVQTWSVAKVREQSEQIFNLMREAMRENEHYGVIPGTKKPTLLKGGAEKLCVMFRVRPEYEVNRSDMEDGHREFEVVCTLYHIPSGSVVGQGVGSCSTMESRYRYRTIAEDTGEPIPNDAKENKKKYAAQGLGMRKIDGAWKWCRIGKGENPDIADQYNTVLKMAKKRALVDGVLTMTAASDVFTQDVEDFVDLHVEVEPEPAKPKVNRQEAVAKLVELLQSPKFTDDERTEFKAILSNTPDEGLRDLYRRYKELADKRVEEKVAERVPESPAERAARAFGGEIVDNGEEELF